MRTGERVSSFQDCKMTNSSEKIVVYAAACPNGTFMPTGGDPALIEISQVTVQARPMGEAEIKKAAEYISKSVDVAKGLIKITTEFVKKDSPWKDNLKAMSAVGDILKGVMKIVPGPPNPMVKQLQDLVNKVSELEKTISASFDELKAFITEVSFFVGIISPASILMRYMRDCLKHPGPEALDNFRVAYKKYPPLKLAYNLLSYFDQESTNPLKQEMKQSKVKSKVVFDKWAEITCRVLGQFLMLEAFAKGLLGKKEDHDEKKLWSGVYKVAEDLEKWRAEYEKDQSYWEEVKSDLETWMSNMNKKEMSNKDKLDSLEKQMDTYLTSDRFYIFVFNYCEWEKDYTYRCPNEKEQIAGCWGVGGCNAFIYRSRNGHKKSDDDYKTLSNKVSACREGKLRYNKDWKKHEKIWLEERHLYDDYGLVCLICRDQNLHFGFIENSREPGRWTDCTMIQEPNQDKFKYSLHVAFD